MIKTAMILAAGEGRRMRPLTLTTPKPLLAVAGKPLIQYHIEKLAAAGIKRIIVNLAYLGEKIEAFLGNGNPFGVELIYSYEPEPLETAGAICYAENILGPESFILINGDVWTDFNFAELVNFHLPSGVEGHLILVASPAHNLSGDFCLGESKRLQLKDTQDPSVHAYTFSGISVLRPSLVTGFAGREKRFPLRDVFSEAIQRKALTGDVHLGNWTDVGTPARLAQLNNEVLNG